MDHLVSIIMPVYNSEFYISKAIDSILNQSYKNIELLISDDGSSDNSKSIIDSYTDPRIIKIHNQKNIGVLKTRNKLLPLTRGSLIAFQDADDISSLSRIEKQVIEFSKDFELGICGTFARYVDVENNYLRSKKLPILHNEIYTSLINGHQFCGASIMLRKKVLKTIKGYPNYFKRLGSEDYYFSAMIVQNFKSMNIPEERYIVTASRGSLCRTVRDVKQLIVSDLIKCLIVDVRKGDLNWIENENYETIQKYENMLLKPYKEDRSLIYRKKSYIESRNNNYLTSIKFILRGMQIAPFKLVNFKILCYLFYKYINSFFKK